MKFACFMQMRGIIFLKPLNIFSVFPGRNSEYILYSVYFRARSEEIVNISVCFRVKREERTDSRTLYSERWKNNWSYLASPYSHRAMADASDWFSWMWGLMLVNISLYIDKFGGWTEDSLQICFSYQNMCFKWCPVYFTPRNFGPLTFERSDIGQ